MANVNNPNGFRAIRRLGGGAIPTYDYFAASNVSLMPGDAVVVATTGLLTLAAVSSAAIFGVCQSKVVGVAATPQKALIVPTLEDIVFVGQSTTWVAAGKKMIGTSCDIQGATGVQVLSSTTTNAVARVLGLSKELNNAVGNYARLEFIFQKSQFTGQA
jgi:hypothetical protein